VPFGADRPDVLHGLFLPRSKFRVNHEPHVAQDDERGELICPALPLPSRLAIQHISQLRCVICGTTYPAATGTRVTSAAWRANSRCRVRLRESRQDADGGTAGGQRPWTHWRYEELIPVDSHCAARPLHIGYTPGLSRRAARRVVGVRELSIKDGGRNPSASFKAAPARWRDEATEYHAKTVAAASTGTRHRRGVFRAAVRPAPR